MDRFPAMCKYHHITTSIHVYRCIVALIGVVVRILSFCYTEAMEGRKTRRSSVLEVKTSNNPCTNWPKLYGGVV